MLEQGQVRVVFDKDSKLHGQYVAVYKAISKDVAEVITADNERTMFDRTDLGYTFANVGRIDLHNDQDKWFFTCTNFWDCECETDHIHYKKLTRCWNCNADWLEQVVADSRVNEVLQMLNKRRVQNEEQGSN